MSMSVKQNLSFYEDRKKLNGILEDALKYYELSDKITVSLLEKWINETQNPAFFISRVFNEAVCNSEVEAEKLLDLLTRFWNSAPRNELNGQSPQDKFALGPSKFKDDEVW